ncbi:MAG: HEPN domain-containing protein [Chloroflexota bacterium]
MHSIVVVSCMSGAVSEWVARAESDFRVATRESMVTAGPSYEAVCFHAQQCVEKLMKAVLIDRSVQPPRTHDLLALAAMVTATIPTWTWPSLELSMLNSAAVGFRYPGDEVEKEDADEMLEVCTRLRVSLLALL